LFLQHPADVAQGGARLQFAEGDDLGDAIAAVLVLNVADHLVPALLAEIDIEIRHGDTLGIEEALEQQAPTQGIEVGDGQGPGNHRTGARAAPRPDRNALMFGPLDEIGDDQEVTRVAHLLDHLELVFQALPVGPGGCLARLPIHLRRINLCVQPSLQARLGLSPQLRGLVAPALGRKGRQNRRDNVRHEGAAARDREGVVDRLGQVGEQLGHLARRLEAVLRGQAPALGLADVAALGDAQQRIVGLVHLGVGEEHLVGRDQRQVVGIGQIDQAVLDARLLGQAVAHDFDIEPAREDSREHL